MSFRPLQIDAQDLTVEHLAGFVDRLRAEGAIGDNPVIIEAVDARGNIVDVRHVTIEIESLPAAWRR